MSRSANFQVLVRGRIAVLVLLICMAVLSGRAGALDLDKSISQCRMDVWTTRDGLPPRDIEAMAQTPDGYLWLGTRAGLVRFDGVAFRVYNAANTPGFTRAMILALAVDQAGELWIGTDGDGFGTLHNGAYARCRVGSGTPKWGQTRAIVASQDGSLWFGGQAEYNLVHRQNGQAKSEAAPLMDVRAMVEDAPGSLWIADAWGGLRHRLPNGALQTCNGGLPSTSLTSLCLDRDGSLWIGTQQNGLCRMSKGQVTTYTVRQGLSNNEIHSVYQDQAGNLWIGTARGLNRMQNGKIEAFRKRDGMFDDNMGAFLEDRELNLWAGTGASLSRLNNTKLTPFTIPALPGAHTRALCQTPDGAVWIGTSEGIARIDHKRQTIYTTRDGLAANDINDVHVDSEGRLWALAKGGAIMMMEQGRFHVVAADSRITQMAHDKNGMVFKDWNSLYRLKTGKDKKKKLVRLTSAQTPNYIFSFCTDSAGELWAGCVAGLAHVVNDRIDVLHDGLPPNTQTLAVASPRAGEIWMGTDKGLAHYQAGHFTCYDRRHGLPDDNLYQLLIDKTGTLWIGGNCGIFAVKIQDVETFARGGLGAIPYRLYEAQDGIRQFPLLFGALKTTDGRLWFKGELGLTVVDPKHLPVNALVPPVVIEQAMFNGKMAPQPQNAQIAPGKGDVEIRYSGLSLAVPEKVRFRYCLEGFDRGWVEAGGRRAAYYTNLPPGTYRFRVMACNNDGVWNSRTPPLVFTLQPRLTQTAWFRAGFALVAVTLTLVLVRWRLRKLRRVNHDLERRIAARTQELVQSNSELQASKEAVEAANARLHALATTDGMTHLANHRAFQDRLRAALAEAERSGQTLTMLLADVDHFKQYNDTYGHPAGDEVLRTLGQVLRENVRPGDCVARYGGEEFAILLPDADMDTAAGIAERIRAATALHAFPCRRVTLSIGVAQSPAGMVCPENLVRYADQALYAAKHNGRNRVEIAGEELCPLCEERADEAPAARVQSLSPAPALTLTEQTSALAVSFAAAPDAPGIMPDIMAASPDGETGDLAPSFRLKTESATPTISTPPPAPTASVETEMRVLMEAGDSAQTLTGLLALLNLRDPETDGHSQRVARYALRLAQEVIRQDAAPLSPDELRDLTLGSLLHDIGKIGVPDAILHKPGALNDAEWEIMRRHPLQGAEILSSFSHLVNALPVVRSHHERWDGTGYPDGLAGEGIPLAARIFALADTLDAMSSDRPYRAALPADTIRQEIRRMAGTQFDPELVRVFLTIPAQEWELLTAVKQQVTEIETGERAELPKAA